MTLTVLYDANCGICRTARRWLDSRAQLVRLEFVAAGSDEARRRYPSLDHEQTLQEITVIGGDGAIYVDDGAWLMCSNSAHPTAPSPRPTLMGAGWISGAGGAPLPAAPAAAGPAGGDGGGRRTQLR